MIATANGRIYARNKYKISILHDSNFFLRTTETKTEKMMRLVQIIDDKSNPTFSTPCNTQYHGIISSFFKNSL
jgi:hypothetical protein